MDNIRSLRKRQGLTQQQLADRLHVVRQTVSKWEKGESAPDGDMLPAVAEALGVPLEELMGLPTPEPWYYRLKKPLFLVLFCAFVVCLGLDIWLERFRADELKVETRLLFAVFILRGAVGFFGGSSAACLIPWAKRRPALGWVLIALAVITTLPIVLWSSGLGWYDVPLLRRIFVSCLANLKLTLALSGALLFIGIGLLRKR